MLLLLLLLQSKLQRDNCAQQSKVQKSAKKVQKVPKPTTKYQNVFTVMPVLQLLAAVELCSEAAERELSAEAAASLPSPGSVPIQGSRRSHTTELIWKNTLKIWKMKHFYTKYILFSGAQAVPWLNPCSNCWGNSSSVQPPLPI